MISVSRVDYGEYLRPSGRGTTHTDSSKAPSLAEEPKMITRPILQELLTDDAASGVIEYVLLAALLALAAIFATHNFGNKLTKEYKQIAKKI